MPVRNPKKHRRNLFEIDNARNLSKNELVETFIPTQSFWRLLSAKHNILLGARGQGKTAIAKMLSHDHLVALAMAGSQPRVTSVIHNQEFIGTYLPTRLEWVGGLKNKSWLDEKEREELFQWRMNIASCIAFIPVAQSCIKTYQRGRVQQAIAEKELTQLLCESWVVDERADIENLMQLRRWLEDTDYKKQIQLLRERAIGSLPVNEPPVGLAFGLELFAPFRQGIRQLSRVLDINANCNWLICLDEAEFLGQMDHRIINSHMRAFPDNVFLKVATMPYCHYTLATNIGAALVPGQDFGYVNMDTDRVLNARTSGEADTIGTQFGRSLFGKLIEASASEYSRGRERNRELPGISDILGESEILSPKNGNWEPDSENMELLKRYGSEETIQRAQKLLGTKAFAPAIGRKINGPLLLRKQVDELKGNSAITAYSGARMAIRCADDNPRHMIKVFNALLMNLSREQRRLLRAKRVSPIRAEDQTRTMRTLSTTTLNQYRSFPDVGPELHKFLKMLGEFMYANLHAAPLTTDQVTSVTIDDSVSDKDWKLVCVAVGHGLLHPNAGLGNPDEMPWREGTFHLAYALAPHFFLLPRRGKSASLSNMRQFQRMTVQEKSSFLVSDERQLFLFDEGAE